MKIKWNKQYNTIALYAFLVIVSSILFSSFIGSIGKLGAFIVVVVKLLMPFIYGLTLAYLLNPIVAFQENKLYPKLLKDKLSPIGRRRLSVFFSLIFLFIIITTFFYIIIPQVSKSISSISSQIPNYIEHIQKLINNLMDKYKNNAFAVEILNKLSNSTEDILQNVYKKLSTAMPEIINTTISITWIIVKMGTQLVLGIIISIYVLLSKEKFFAQCKKFLNALFPNKFINAVLAITYNIHKVFSGFISGKLLDSLIIGILCFIGTNLMNLHYSMLISVIIGITNIIPYFGPFIGAIPSVLLLFMVSPVQAVIFGVFVLLLQQLDGNIIGPKILGDSTGLSAFWVIFAITLFGGLWGFVGMFIGVPLFAVIYSMLKVYIEYRLKKKGKPTNTNYYASKQNPLLVKANITPIPPESDETDNDNIQ